MKKTEIDMLETALGQLHIWRREVVTMVQVMSQEQDPIKLKKMMENVEIEEAERSKNLVPAI